MKNINTRRRIECLIPAVIGLGLILFARPLTGAVNVILGIGLLLGALTGFYTFWQNRQADRGDALVLLVGSIIAAALGVWVLTHLTTFGRFINYVVGVLMILGGAQWLFFNRAVLGANVVTLLALVVIGLGIALLFVHASAITLIIRIVGAGLIFSSLCGLLGVDPRV